jgi:hypothetical protein
VKIFRKIKPATVRPFPKAIKPGKISGETARKLLAVSIASTSNWRKR